MITMRITRRQLRRLIIESTDLVMSFKNALRQNFIDTGEVHEGTPIYAQQYDDGCQVEFVIDIAVGSFASEAYLVYIQTKGPDCFRKGYANHVMGKLTSLLDSIGMSMILEVESYGAMSDDSLARFYMNHGFEYTGEGMFMRRYPQ